jgi:hypothetical protein
VTRSDDWPLFDRKFWLKAISHEKWGFKWFKSMGILTIVLRNIWFMNHQDPTLRKANLHRFGVSWRPGNHTSFFGHRDAPSRRLMVGFLSDVTRCWFGKGESPAFSNSPRLPPQARWSGQISSFGKAAGPGPRWSKAQVGCTSHRQDWKFGLPWSLRRRWSQMHEVWCAA